MGKKYKTFYIYYSFLHAKCYVCYKNYNFLKKYQPFGKINIFKNKWKIGHQAVREIERG